MAGITREEFHNFYEESLLPRLEKYEIIRQNNIKVLPKTDKAKSEIFFEKKWRTKWKIFTISLVKRKIEESQ